MGVAIVVTMKLGDTDVFVSSTGSSIIEKLAFGVPFARRLDHVFAQYRTSSLSSKPFL